MNLNEAVLLKKDQMIRSLQENIKIPSVESEPAPGAP